MSNDGSYTIGDQIGINRRQLLRTVSASPLATLALPAPAAATEDVQITVEQNGEEVATVSPISTDRSIQDFYRYDRIDNASANTPMNVREADVSKLFFYRRSGSDNPLSLVVIHDTVRDGDGGEVRFDFQPNGLPTGGSWVVQDDSGDSSYGRTSVRWGWAPCCTDGGAYRGGFEDGVQVTIDPAFISGIRRWDLVDGDGSVASELSEAPVTLTVGGRSVDSLADQKRTLADRIDTNALGLMDDRGRVEPALQGLVAAAESESGASRSEVREAIQRMLAGERITDAVLAGAGPGSSPHLDTDTNVSRLTTEFAVNPMLELIFAGISFLKVGRAIPGLGGVLEDGAEWLGRTVADFAGIFSETLETIIRQRAMEAGLSIFRGAEAVTANKGQELAEQEFREVRDTRGTPFIEDSSAIIFQDMLFNDERNFGDLETDPLDESVERLIDGLDTEPSGLQLEGDTGAALDAAEQHLQAVNDSYETVDSVLTDEIGALFLQNIGVLSGVLLAVAVVAGVFGWTIFTLPVAGIAGAAATLVGLGGVGVSMVLWGTGTGGILGNRHRNQIAVSDILDPSGG